MRVVFFTVPVVAVVSSLTAGCGGSDSNQQSGGANNVTGLPGVGGSTTATPGGAASGGVAATSTGGVVGSGNTPGFGAGPSATGGSGAFGTGGVIGTGGVSTPTSGGSVGAGGDSSNGGASSTGGGSAAGGTSGTGGAGTGGSTGKGMCCASGDCLCHGTPPTAPTSKNGPYKTANFPMTTGTVYYPTDADPPLAGVSICPGFLNTGPEMAPWGPFYASWGIVTVVTSTGAGDLPNIRGMKLVAAIQELKKQNTGTGPLAGKLSDRFGTSGYSMGGGGTTFASESDPTFKTSVGLAAWGPDGATVKTPTLFICSDADTVAGCSGTNSSYGVIPSPTPKMILDIPNETHFNWFSPTDAGMGESGAYALAFQKVFLEGDERWKAILLTKPTIGTVKTANIQ